MSRWQQLGEVPDSEDEEGSFSQDEDIVLQPTTTSTPEEYNNDKDTTSSLHKGSHDPIWDIPDSSQEIEPLPQLRAPTTVDGEEPVCLVSSPLSSAKSNEGLPPINQYGSLARTIQPESSEDLSRVPSRSPSPVSEPVERNNKLSSVLGHAESDDELQILSPPRKKQKTSSPRSQTSGSSRCHDDNTPMRDPRRQEPVAAANLEARLLSMRNERSLRPRKPIQEHPYVLENAQYASVFKKHGVQPLRMALMDERQRQRRRQAGQEEEEEDGDFQDDSQGSGQPHHDLDSQIKDLDDIIEELNNVESSSLPKTSPGLPQIGQSSQASSGSNTDDTSVLEDDLPDLKDLLSKPVQLSSKSKKRRTLPIGKTPKTGSKLRIPPPIASTPPAQEDLSAGSPILADGDGWMVPSSDDEPVHNAIPGSPQQVPAAVVIPDDTTSSSGSEDSGSDSDMSTKSVRAAQNKAFGKRIRGVLPASWLRLDQKSGPTAAPKGGREYRDHSPEREQRKGVAQTRHAIASADIPADFFEESDDETLPRPERPTTDDAYSRQVHLALQPAGESSRGFEIFTDDEGSVVEEDHIDRMYSGPKKRQLNLSDSFQRIVKRPKTKKTGPRSLNSTSGQRRIDSIFSGHKSSGSKRTGTSKKSSHSTKKRSRQTGTKTPQQPRAPALSILDIIDSDAPQFLKIAARTAKRQPHQGRVSPTRKSINLATRADHVDAATVLIRWKAGSITPRPSVTAAMSKQAYGNRARGPLTERSANARSAPRRPPNQGGQQQSTRHLKKTTSAGDSVNFNGANLSAKDDATKYAPRAQPASLKTASAHSHFRPAQLETDEGRRDHSLTFHTQKRLLDRLYRSRNQNPSAPSIAGTIGGVGGTRPQDHAIPKPPPSKETRPPGARPPRRRTKKQIRPRQIDLEAPEYSRSNDPLPTEPLTVTVPTTEPTRVQGDKLTGLGPYGTHYTHHFEAFPLKVGVFFHSSTLIGAGVLAEVATLDSNVLRSTARPTVHFTLGEQPLRWNTWNSQVSSEVGIVVDFIVDQLEVHLEGRRDIGQDKVIGAASFIVDYTKDALSYHQDADEKAGFARLFEVLGGLDKRMNAAVCRLTIENSSKTELLAKVYDRLIIAAAVLWKMSVGTPTLFAEQMQLETLLQDLAKTAMSGLVALGTRHLRATYDELLNGATRERGIRGDKTSIHSWLLVMKVLEMANIPRRSFWDVLQLVLIPADLGLSTDAAHLEDIWRSFFTMVPLTEFTSAGVLSPGRRHDIITDGWTIPLQLLKRVFQLYRDNPRQEASFNIYCRALIARCHYLVQQWGWKKCVAVVGVIFDFFGSQGLSHLRNEEVYQSPGFLEQLAEEPSLDVKPEDKPFHIFLKLLALSLQRLAEDGLTKDVRNMVARTMPNHDRQHLKEQVIRQRDLAALRNHHDLLVTLFWASTPETRPNPTLIERLVNPADSHKEACLINLRAWGQLARYIVASGEASLSFKPFRHWCNNFFLQTLRQYDSVESDLQKQFMSLPKDDRQNISKTAREETVKRNKETVGDILYLSVSASLDVMAQAPDLQAAAICFDPCQLKHVFRHFSVAPAELDWSILLAALKILDGLLGRISEFKDGGDSQQSESQLMNTLALADDSLLQIDNDVASDFFSVARTILCCRRDRSTSAIVALNKHECEKLATLISARLGHKLVEAGLLRVMDMFKAGKYGLFELPPAELSMKQRKWLVLFVSSLLEQGLPDFGAADVGLEDIWVLALVKPRNALAFENELAQQLFKSGAAFVAEAVQGLGLNPAYGTNRAMFEFVLGVMRKRVRESAPPQQRQAKLQAGRALQRTMDQIKRDLSVLLSDQHEHLEFVRFVREIISLIRSQAADFVRVDDFFYQISRDYSPPEQDPQLQVAGMHAYALKLSEGDESAVYQLFYYLLNNLKAAVMNGSLTDQVDMLKEAMGNPTMYRFVIGHMVPLVMRAYDKAMAQQPQTWEKDCVALILCVFRHALTAKHEERIFQSSLGSEDAEAWAKTMTAVAAHCRALVHHAGRPGSRTATLGSEATYCFHHVRSAMAFVELVYPALRASLLEDTAGDTSPGEHISRLTQAIKDAHQALRLAYEFLVDVSQPHTPRGTSSTALESTLADRLLDDIRKNWTCANGTITVCSPHKSTSGAAPPPGTKWPPALGEYEDEKRLFASGWSNLSAWHKRCFGEEEEEGGDDRRRVTQGGRNRGWEEVVWF